MEKVVPEEVALLLETQEMGELAVLQELETSQELDNLVVEAQVALPSHTMLLQAVEEALSGEAVELILEAQRKERAVLQLDLEPVVQEVLLSIMEDLPLAELDLRDSL